jgi:hypothetical protein
VGTIEETPDPADHCRRPIAENLLTDNLDISSKKTRQRFARRNRLKAKGRHKSRVFCETPFGRKVTADLFIRDLASFLAGNHSSETADPPPRDLGQLVSQLESEDIAMCALSPLLHSIHRGWDHDDDPARALCQKIGEHLRDRLALEKLFDAKPATAKKNSRAGRYAWKYYKPDWSADECVEAGHWLFQCAMSLNYFDYDEDGFPKIAVWLQPELTRLREEMLLRDQVLLPHTTKPPDWTGQHVQYDNRLQANFVRGWRGQRPETKKVIEAAFTRDDFMHARGVNSLQRVPFRIDEQMLALVDRFAVDVMGHAGKQRDAGADRLAVSDDIATARVLAGKPFYLTYNCDARGRIYPIPHFNYGREDHVRALFKFSNGARIAPYYDDSQWLEIHCANCEGTTDKDPWDARIKWVADHREQIQKIAADPGGTFDVWRGVGKPFRYVAACRELAAFWAAPDKFITHLPIAFDGSANGIQHLALLSRDADAGKMVNLTNSDKPHDVYERVAKRVKSNIQNESGNWAVWWRTRFELWDDRKIRKLLKAPAMTYAYNVSDYGMADQIIEAFSEISNEALDKRAAKYLAEKTREATEQLLPGPADVMKYIIGIAAHCADDDRPMEWTSPTGFPVSIRHQSAKTKRVRLVANGRPVEYLVAYDCHPGILKKKATDAAAPNVVHSLDASHLILSVNAAVSDGITDIVTVHDSFSCLAPHAQRFNQIIRRELGLMYHCHHPLRQLRDGNIRNADALPLPDYGDLDPLAVQDAEYPWA